MSDTKCAPYPWVQDKYGNVKNANGETVKLTGFALSCGYTPKDDSCYVNTKMAIAAPELLEALEELVSATTSVRGIDEDMENFYCTKAFVKAREAIAKAKGES